jgi:hypothetical protein
VEITDTEHSGEKTQTMDMTKKEAITHSLEITDAEHSSQQSANSDHGCDRRSHHLHAVEIADTEHSGEQTETMGVIEEATAHKLWRSKMQNTVMSKLGP